MATVKATEATEAPEVLTLEFSPKQAPHVLMALQRWTVNRERTRRDANLGSVEEILTLQADEDNTLPKGALQLARAADHMRAVYDNVKVSVGPKIFAKFAEGKSKAD